SPPRLTHFPYTTLFRSCAIEKASAPFKRFVDFSRLTSVAVRTKHVFNFAQKRAKQVASGTPMKSALFSEDWVGFGIALLYESLRSEEHTSELQSCFDLV